MDRKKFIRNAVGAVAAVTIGKYLPVPLPDTPGLGGEAFKHIVEYPLTPEQSYEFIRIFFPHGYIMPNDVLVDAHGTQWWVDQSLVMHDINNKRPNMQVVERERQHLTEHYRRLCSAIPEDYGQEEILS